MKKRKHEEYRFIVKWIVGCTMYFRPFKRDAAAVRYQEFLIECQGVKPEDVRIVMK
jgi:hypothetical protein